MFSVIAAPLQITKFLLSLASLPALLYTIRSNSLPLVLRRELSVLVNDEFWATILRRYSVPTDTKNGILTEIGLAKPLPISVAFWKFPSWSDR